MREEYAGNLSARPDGDFAHRLQGDCRCGVTHGDEQQPRQSVRSFSLPRNGRTKVVARQTEWQLLDANGDEVAIHVRKDFSDGSKQYPWRRGNVWGLGELEPAGLPLYGAHILARAAPGAEVVVTEGEKAADALNSRGILAVGTVTGGDTTPSVETLAPLVGHRVTLWPDNDEKGAKHMRSIADVLAGLGEYARLVNWRSAPAKGDAADFTGTDQELRALLDAARTLSSLTSLSSQEVPWPKPFAGDAYLGLAGDFVGGVAPYSEASEPALLAHFLAGVAAMIGSKVYAEAGDAIHPARFNAALVGESSKGRKGSSWQPVRRVLDMTQPGFTAANVVEGLASGEGLIWQVRDRITKSEMVGKGENRYRQEVEVDPGIADKRLLVVESELATTLRVMQREGNTLSAVIRRAWDSGELRTITKNSPARATGAHICIAGHITREELVRYLDRSELANGFANRFLFFASKRGRVLPDGEGTPDGVLVPIAEGLRAVLTWAEHPRRLRRDTAASEIWHDVYEDLSEGRPGLVGCVTNRAEAQVLRLSVLYAALDCSEQIRAEHLMAALDIWKYAEASAKWVFGQATGNPDADAVLAQVRDAGGEMRREAIVKALSGHVFGQRLDRALLMLEAASLLVKQKVPTGGRPSEVWRVA